MVSGRLRLASFPPVLKAAFTVAWIVIVGGWCALLILAASATNAPGAGALVFMELLFAVVTSLFLTFLLVEMYSYAVWLEGTVLAVRHSYGTRRWDLSSAAVEVRASPGQARLIVRDPGSGRRTQMKLRRPQLRYASALAGAIMAGRPGDPSAYQAAAALSKAG